MTEYSFTLIPFPNPDIPKIMITGGISRNGNLLRVQYFLTGNTNEIFFPEPVAFPSRKDGLWLSTCFECFIAIPDQPHYWEFNFSPSGEWNVFRMEAYRRIGFGQEDLIQEVGLNVSREPDSFRLDASVDLSPLIDPQINLQAGPTSVIQTRSGRESYWALTHPAIQADFHVRESFTLVLEGTDPPE